MWSAAHDTNKRRTSGPSERDIKLHEKTILVILSSLWLSSQADVIRRIKRHCFHAHRYKRKKAKSL